jgi:hypothetical protein
VKKTFFIVKVAMSAQLDDATGFLLQERFEGTVTDARGLLQTDAYKDGEYLIIEDTSGIVRKSTETVKKSKVEFTPTRKRPRKEKAAK